ncbi:nuclear transport factor 2 family protein [Nocardia sp. BMG111209]|uniref:nuclear transport factor 2 family protein n=1 Tax=Nocardia sp. BMG111209 TaxID=1160137 RepID=UPI00037D5B9E|nr:nuclear transport factor 2 family protein [Nocardia sp. BMG111209]
MTDREDIVDVLVRYATGIDDRDWSLFRTCFTDDARFDYGGIGTWNDPDALTEYMRRSHSGPSLHRLSNFVVDIDADEAVSRTYVDAQVMGPRGFGVVRTFGRYDDRWRRTPDGWRITFRRTRLHGARLPGPLSLIPPTLAHRLLALTARLGTQSAASRHFADEENES